MITPSYGVTATERVLPNLTLTFTTASLDSKITFTRTGNTATVVNSNGNVAAINADLPRFDYDPVTKVIKGLLIEESRQNICTYSEDFTNGATTGWGAINLTPSADTTVSPDGTQNADSLFETTTNGQHRLDKVLTNAAGDYVFSCFIKKAGSRYASIRIGTAGAYIDLDNGAIVTSGGATANSISYGNGWYRLWVYVTGVAANVTIRINNNGANAGIAPSYAGNTANAIAVWGAQFEAGAFVTSYIPTTTASVTRNADIATMTSTNFSSWWAATNGATVVTAQQSTVSGTRPWVQFDDNTANNIIALRGNTTNPELYVKATTDQAQIDAGTIAASTNYNLAGAWNTDNCGAAINGGAAVTDLSATIPTVTQARLGSDGTNYLNGWLRSLRYWPQRLTDAEIQAFSK